MDAKTDEARPDAAAAEWAVPKGEPRLAPEELARWREATDRVRTLAMRDGLSKSEAARRAGMPMGTFSPWYDGTYTGSIAGRTRVVERWLDSLEESARFSAAAIAVPSFVRTRTADEIANLCAYAQALPCMGLVVLGPGMGKTATARHYAATRPHTTLVTMRPITSTTRHMVTDISVAIGVYERNPARLDRAIGKRLERNGRQTLLIVDEAQNLADTAVNQLRYWHDEFGVGIVLMGNDEMYGRFGGPTPKPGYAQLHRRFSMRLHRMAPLQADIDAYVSAWGIVDPDIAALARAIGKKPGALGQIRETLVLAQMIANGAEQKLAAEHVRQAWENRGGDLPEVARRRQVAP